MALPLTASAVAPATHAIHAPFRGGEVAQVARRVVDIAREGLKRRGHGEEIYLAPLDETLDLNETPAERWLDKYNGEWGGDVTRVFDEAEM